MKEKGEIEIEIRNMSGLGTEIEDEERDRDQDGNMPLVDIKVLSVKRQEEKRPEPTHWHKSRQLHQLAFNALSEIIKVEIIEKNRVMYLTDLFSQYKSLLLEFGEGQVHAEDIQEYRAENLEIKLMKVFGDRVTIECSMGYPLAEQIETEITYTFQEDNEIIPSGIHKVNGLSTHVAFDNFDRFVDTPTGKDTLHDTVGIIYQFCCEYEEESDSDSSSGLETINPCQPQKVKAVDKDLIWSMFLSQIDLISMWSGYNCKINLGQSKIQTVQYLSPINDSPTSLSVVQETLNIAKNIAEKCNQSQIIATFDLAIAKLAMKIQHTKKPEFDNVFIKGAFHMQMAYFKAIGKYIDSSGLIEILVEAEALAGGSMNSFLDSKHFNRCKRLHPLAAGALQVLNFERYLSEVDNSTLVNEFREGAFGVRRTKSCLGRSPMGLTLEQTINADAGNTLTGVSHFTNSICARQRTPCYREMLRMFTEFTEFTDAKDDHSRN
ncbi:hypothetical protein EVAR_69886_1 [Eumeta japonica]|uniref:Uncharacterized protein n=1 Tax=Eumeta variegata TaxID=151549 RepID=A0A4C1ZWK8_EUMVA|nr:hypothetical protein EVAR_69886_1 [Eumeta japonica]